MLVSLAVVALRWWGVSGRKSTLCWAFGLAGMFAASDEWHQASVPGRGGGLRDVLIGTGEALLAALVWSAGGMT